MELKGVDRCESRTLVCTADTRTWPPADRAVLYLGEWCRTHALKAEWSKRDHEVLPYHWRKVDERHGDYRRLHALFEDVLPRLAAVLDDIHGERHSVRYWRIVVGAWLGYFIGVLFDRFRALEVAFESGRVDAMPVVRCGPLERVPRNMSDFLHESATDAGNQHLFSLLGTLMAPELVRVVDSESFSWAQGAGAVREGCSIAAFMMSRGVSKLSRHRVVASLAYFRTGEIAKLGWRLGALPLSPIPRFRSRVFPIDASMRERLTLGLRGDRFSQVLDAMLKQCLPSAYLEGYAALSRLTRCVFPKSVDAIVDDNALHVNEVYKIWAATATERGAKLAICQHGGFYGSGEWSDDEVHEKAIADVFLNWGWEQTPTSSPLPSPLLSRLLTRRKRFRNDTRKVSTRVAWIANMFPRYAGSQRSMPAASEALGYIEDQVAFFRALPPTLRSHLWLRPYHRDWGWGFLPRLQEAGFDAANVCTHKMSLIEQLGQSRIGVYTANTTVHLEMFAMNIPTLLYWNRAIWRNRPEAQPYYEALRTAGVLHDTPESAAAMLAQIYDDPWVWWNGGTLQSAVQRYLQRFGLASSNWACDWKVGLARTNLFQQQEAVPPSPV